MGKWERRKGAEERVDEEMERWEGAGKENKGWKEGLWVKVSIT